MERADLIAEIQNGTNDVYWVTFSDEELIALYNKVVDLKKASLQEAMDNLDAKKDSVKTGIGIKIQPIEEQPA